MYFLTSLMSSVSSHCIVCDTVHTSHTYIVTQNTKFDNITWVKNFKVAMQIATFLLAMSTKAVFTMIYASVY